jgi:hypothetical protein
MIAPVSATTMSPFEITGDFPSGCTAYSSGDARTVPTFRW